MSNFEKSSLIDLSESDRYDFSCGICLEIFNNPVETKCCRKTFCKECITSWINTNQVCPNDRQVLRVDDLIKPSLITINLLSKINESNNFENESQEKVRFESSSENSKDCHRRRLEVDRNVQQNEEIDRVFMRPNFFNIFWISIIVLIIISMIPITKIISTIFTIITTILNPVIVIANIISLIIALIFKILTTFITLLKNIMEMIMTTIIAFMTIMIFKLLSTR
jgi:fumarate reductase subunit C